MSIIRLLIPKMEPSPAHCKKTSPFDFRTRVQLTQNTGQIPNGASTEIRYVSHIAGAELNLQLASGETPSTLQPFNPLHAPFSKRNDGGLVPFGERWNRPSGAVGGLPPYDLRILTRMRQTMKP